MNHTFPFTRSVETLQPAADRNVAAEFAAPAETFTLSDHENRLHFFDRLAQTARPPVATRFKPVSTAA
jgi:hypothetical protein